MRRTRGDITRFFRLTAEGLPEDFRGELVFFAVDDFVDGAVLFGGVEGAPASWLEA